MTKNKKSQIPVVTDIPLKNTDTPLVIDLPDGQKLVVGKLTTGSVIEVATWRGTGRPDSRTSRLMLGMSDAATVSQVPEVSETSEPTSNNVATNIVQKLGNGIVAKAIASAAGIAAGGFNFVKNFLASVSSKKGAGKVTLAQPYSQEPSEIDDDVSEWLNQITAKAQAQHERKLTIERKKAANLPTSKKPTAKKTPAKTVKKAAAKKKAR